MALTIYGKKTSGVIEIRVVAYCSEDVEDLAFISSGITDSIRGKIGKCSDCAMRSAA